VYYAETPPVGDRVTQTAVSEFRQRNTGRNRYYLDQTLAGEMDRQDHYREQDTLLMLDLDYFTKKQ
jgi:GGDEF domain-containing protein